MECIKYELAKELKDAGFKQKGQNIYIGPNVADNNPGGEYYYIPTLDELIEACGEGFGSLIRGADDMWIGVPSWKMEGVIHDHIVGTTRKEAVARLWLALNKK